MCLPLEFLLGLPPFSYHGMLRSASRKDSCTSRSWYPCWKWVNLGNPCSTGRRFLSTAAAPEAQCRFAHSLATGKAKALGCETNSGNLTPTGLTLYCSVSRGVFCIAEVHHFLLCSLFSYLPVQHISLLLLYKEVCCDRWWWRARLRPQAKRFGT